MPENKAKTYPRIRKILDRPYLAMVLMALVVYIPSFLFARGMKSFFPEFKEQFRPDILFDIALSLAALLLFKRLFKGEFTGNFSCRHFGKGMLLLIPMLLFVVMNFLSVDYASLTTRQVVLCFFDALAVGLFEETAFRALASANFMRVRPDGRGLCLFALLSGLFFGLSHLVNIVTVHAPLDMTLLQVAVASGIGVLMSAVYFRTGSIVPGIVYHLLVDFPNFMLPEIEGEPEPASGSTIVVQCVLGLILAALGLWYLRRRKRDAMKKIWEEKWSQPADEAP